MPERTLQSLLRRLDAFGERPALVAVGGGGRSSSHRALADQALRLAGGLALRGVSPGEPVALFAPNSPEWVVANFALLAVGAVPVPLDIRQGSDHLAHALHDSACQRAFTTADHADALRRAAGEDGTLELFLLDSSPRHGGEADCTPWRALLAEPVERPPERHADDVAVLFYTSGTTGLPKGVPLTHRNVMFNLDGLGGEKLVARHDRVLLPLPLHHVYPYVVGMLLPLAAGAALVFPAGISGPEIAAALREGRSSALIGVPRLYETLIEAVTRRLATRGRLAEGAFRGLLGLSTWLRRRLGVRAGKLLFAPLHKQLGRDLRLAVSGGARLDPELAWRLEGLGWEVLTGYGLTETAPIVAFNPPAGKKLDAAGRPLAGMEVRLDPVEGKTDGEIVVRGPGVFAGYHDAPDKTREAFTEDGWFRTGDLGRLDEDGFLHVAARVKETIVLPGGENVFPEALEDAFTAAPHIREAAVIERDGRLVLLAVPEASALRAGGDAEQRVREEARAASRGVASFQRVSDVVVTREALPRTTLGKLRRHELDEIYERAKAGIAPPPVEATLSEDDRALTEDPRAGHVWRWLERRFPGRRLTPEASLHLDLGIDSLDWVTLSLELADEAGLQLDEERITRLDTVRDLLHAVREAPSEPSGEALSLSAAQARWIAPKGRALVLAARLLFALNRLAMRALFRAEVRGLDRLPQRGPFILAPNHVSYLDSFVLAAALPYARLGRAYWGGYRDILFASRPRRLFSRIANIFPVDPAHAPLASLAFGKAVLERGDVLVWFPEGGRSRNGELQRFLPGIGRLAEATGAPIVPVHIAGTFAALPPDRMLPRPRRVSVSIGEALPVERLAGTGEGGERIAEGLRRAVAALAGKEPASAA